MKIGFYDQFIETDCFRKWNIIPTLQICLLTSKTSSKVEYILIFYEKTFFLLKLDSYKMYKSNGHEEQIDCFILKEKKKSTCPR